MKVINEYPGSHHYETSYTKTEFFCPSCGKQEVWEGGYGQEGEYDLGVESYCAACGKRHHLDHSCEIVYDANQLGIIAQLRSGVTSVPTTKRIG